MSISGINMAGGMQMASTSISSMVANLQKLMPQDDPNNPLAQEMQSFLKDMNLAEKGLGLDPAAALLAIGGAVNNLVATLGAQDHEGIAEQIRETRGGEFDTMENLLGISKSSGDKKSEEVQALIKKAMGMIADADGIQSLEDLAKILAILSHVFTNMTDVQLAQVSSAITEFAKLAIGESSGNPNKQMAILETISKMVEDSGVSVDLTEINHMKAEVSNHLTEEAVAESRKTGEKELFHQSKEGVTAFGATDTNYLDGGQKQDRPELKEITAAQIAQAGALSYFEGKSMHNRQGDTTDDSFWIERVQNPNQAWLSDAKHQAVKDTVKAFFTHIYPELQKVAMEISSNAADQIPDVQDSAGNYASDLIAQMDNLVGGDAIQGINSGLDIPPDGITVF